MIVGASLDSLAATACGLKANRGRVPPSRRGEPEAPHGLDVLLVDLLGFWNRGDYLVHARFAREVNYSFEA